MNDCPYRNMCKDNGVKCDTCVNNPHRSYYIPEPYYPYYVPYYPPHYPITWYTTGGSTSTPRIDNT